MARRAERESGFTLLEVMIAVAVLAMIGAVTFKSFDGAYDLKRRVESAEDRDQAVRCRVDERGIDWSRDVVPAVAGGQQ